MKYTFPMIEHITDVLPAIEGRPEFIVAEREHYTVVNYMVAMADTFPSVNTLRLTNGTTSSPIFETKDDYLAAIRRECRGLLFHLDGRIMSRRLHKFFNVNERDETQFDKIDLDQPHVILEKLDGSMITPVVVGKNIRWGTKMGITGVAMGAEEFVAKHPKYAYFARGMIGRGFTPIFEWCSRKQRIVIDYPEDRLVLIAVRNTITGEYLPYSALLDYNQYHGIDVVKCYKGTASNMEHLMAETKSSENIEGWIIRFDDGHMLKVKGDWYVRIHKTKDSLSQEKNVIDLIVNGTMDDTKALMLPEDRDRVEKFEKKFWDGFHRKANEYEAYYNFLVNEKNMDRKSFAIELMPSLKEKDHIAPSIMFGMYNYRSPHDMMLDIVRNNISTQSKVDLVRHLWYNTNWND